MQTQPSLLRKLFGFTEPVDRRTYAITGFALMFLKYALDAGVVYFVTQKWFRPWDYLNPVYSMRSHRL